MGIRAERTHFPSPCNFFSSALIFPPVGVHATAQREKFCPISRWSCVRAYCACRQLVRTVSSPRSAVVGRGALGGGVCSSSLKTLPMPSPHSPPSTPPPRRHGLQTPSSGGRKTSRPAFCSVGAVHLLGTAIAACIAPPHPTLHSIHSERRLRFLIP